MTLCPETSASVMKTGMTLLSGKIRDKTYDLVITGPGVFNSAHAVTAYLEKSSPALMLHIGIAGVFKETGLDIGDIAIATREHYIHTGIQTGTLEKEGLPFDLIQADFLSRKGMYPFDLDRVDHYHEILSRALAHKNKFRVVKGPFITVSTITSTLEQAGLLYLAFSPVMEAMEGAACAHVAALYGLPMIEVRAGSNFVGERDKSKWDIDQAIKHLGAVCSLI